MFSREKQKYGTSSHESQPCLYQPCPVPSHNSSNGVSLRPRLQQLSLRPSGDSVNWDFKDPLLPQKDFDKFYNPPDSSTCSSTGPLSASPCPKQFLLYKCMWHPSPHTHLIHKLYPCNTCWEHTPSHMKFFLNQTNEAGIIVQFILTRGTKSLFLKCSMVIPLSLPVTPPQNPLINIITS